MQTDNAPLPRFIEIERTVAEIDGALTVDDPMMPDEALAHRVSSAVTRPAFRQLAVDSLRALLHLTNLAPTSDVLDVGSGLGRVAMPLTRYLTTGTYTGIDVMADLVEDSQQRIGSRFDNFRFQHVDVFSGMYNKGAEAQPQSLRFDLPDDQFDTIFLFSVFTHMFPDDVLNYYTEFRRILKPGGIVLATFFVLNERSERHIAEGKTKFRFAHEHRGVRINKKELPEGAVAYPEAVADGLARDSGLEKLYVSYGSWAGYPRALTGQDAVIFRKR